MTAAIAALGSLNAGCMCALAVRVRASFGKLPSRADRSHTKRDSPVAKCEASSMALTKPSTRCRLLCAYRNLLALRWQRPTIHPSLLSLADLQGVQGPKLFRRDGHVFTSFAPSDSHPVARQLASQQSVCTRLAPLSCAYTTYSGTSLALHAGSVSCFVAPPAVVVSGSWFRFGSPFDQYFHIPSGLIIVRPCQHSACLKVAAR